MTTRQTLPPAIAAAKTGFSTANAAAGAVPILKPAPGIRISVCWARCADAILIWSRTSDARSSGVSMPGVLSTAPGVHETIESPLAREALDRIGALYRIEDTIRGKPPDQRLAVRLAHMAPLMNNLRD